MDRERQIEKDIQRKIDGERQIEKDRQRKIDKERQIEKIDKYINR